MVLMWEPGEGASRTDSVVVHDKDDGYLRALGMPGTRGGRCGGSGPGAWMTQSDRWLSMIERLIGEPHAQPNPGFVV